MRQFQGIILNSGSFSASLYVVKDRDCPQKGLLNEPESAEERISLFGEALECTVSELRRLADEANLPEAHDILEAQAMMVEDIDFQEAVRDKIVQGHKKAAQAVLECSEEYAGLFLAMDDAVFKSKAQDIRDVSSRLLQAMQSLLSGGRQDSDKPELPQESALFFERLLPSHFAEVEKARPAGILLREGSERSHLAILCAEAGIPLLSCPDIEIHSECNGMRICVFTDGRIVLDPDDEQLRRFAAEETRRSEASSEVQAVEGPAGKKGAAFLSAAKSQNGSPDGQPQDESLRYQGEDIQILLNIDGGYFSRHPDARFHCDGIGLLRSEFSYLGRDNLPTEDELFEEYRNAVLAMQGQRCVIRTLDLGSDKQAGCLTRPSEPNPALGIRGIRYSLFQPELFRTQLRAIYRASAFGPLAMMFPMVCSVEEIRQAKEMAAQVREELSREGCPFEEIETGIMIETPAAALLCGDWAGEADFFCVGSNDLTQYTLAADRENATLGKALNEFHPAMRLLLRHIAATARNHHKELSLCGELARKPEALPLLLEWGYRRFSVSSVHLTAVRERIRAELSNHDSVHSPLNDSPNPPQNSYQIIGKSFQNRF